MSLVLDHDCRGAALPLSMAIWLLGTRRICIALPRVAISDHVDNLQTVPHNFASAACAGKSRAMKLSRSGQKVKSVAAGP